MQPQSSPSCHRRIQQIVLTDPLRFAVQMSLDVGEHAQQKTEPLSKTCFLLLVVRHGAFFVQRLKANFRVNFKCSLMAIWQPNNLHDRF